MLSKRYESTEVYSRTWFHAPFGTYGHPEVVDIQIENAT